VEQANEYSSPCWFQRHSRLDLVDAGKVNADGVRLRQPDRIAGSVSGGSTVKTPLADEPGSEFQQLIGVVYGRKADIRIAGNAAAPRSG